MSGHQDLQIFVPKLNKSEYFLANLSWGSETQLQVVKNLKKLTKQEKG